MKENVFKFLLSAVLMFSMQFAYAQPGDGFDCDCDDEYVPVCVEEDGFFFTMPNACIAECLGFTEFTEGECENEWEDDWDDDWGDDDWDDDEWDDDWGFDCDCDEDVWEPVCVEHEGCIFTMASACMAECFGYTDYTDGECENEIDKEM